MAPAQSVAQGVQPPQDTTASDTNSVDQAVDRFSNAFSEAIRLFFEGNWDGLYTHLADGAFYLFVLFTERGLQALAAFLLLYVIYRLLSITLEQTLDRAESI